MSFDLHKAIAVDAKIPTTDQTLRIIKVYDVCSVLLSTEAVATNRTGWNNIRDFLIGFHEHSSGFGVPW